MHKAKITFSQLIVFLVRNKFNYIVRKHDGIKYVKHYTCWNQLLSLMFGQLSNRESLRDLIVTLNAHHEDVLKPTHPHIVNGYSFIDHHSLDDYYDSTDLVIKIELYRQRFGFPPT